MTDSAQQEITIEQVLSKETWTSQEYQLYCKTCPDPIKLRKFLSALETETPKPTGATAIKIGIMQFAAGKFTQAIETLTAGTDNKDRHYFSGLANMHIRHYDKAIEELQRASSKGWDAGEIAILVCEMTALKGDITEAEKLLSKIKAPASTSASYICASGLVKELAGFGEQAADLYRQAIDLDDRCVAAIFRLAYYYDLHGLESEAIDLYIQCIAIPPIHLGALLNLAVLYDDKGLYDKSIRCLNRILAANPNHARAGLFLRDARASQTMYFDEDKARQTAKRNAVLDIPITDFELSVRARNCLKKMNIFTLGDLVNTSEADLLGYKNFGETSLVEIHEMLTSKDLYLGQALDEDDDLIKMGLALASIEPLAGVDEQTLATPIDQMELSVRARRAIEAMSIKTIGELAAKSEVELMSCKNFGQTSLVEIRQKLNDYNLSLRESK